MTTNTSKHRLTLFINSSIQKQARAQAIVEDLTLTAFVEKAIINSLPRETIIKRVEIADLSSQK